MSEYMDNQLEYEAHVERLIIIIYSVFCGCLAYISSQRGWQMWYFAFFLAGFAICWSLFLTKSKTFQFRATVTVVLMQFGVLVYSIKSDDILSSLPVVGSFIILTGLYEILRLINICMVCYFFLIVHHVVINHSVPFTTPEDSIRVILRLCSVVIAGYATYYLVYNQKQGRKRQLEAIEELKEAERSRDDFLANVSHELRTPINTICGMSEMALRENLSEEVRQEVFNIQTSGRNLLAVVSDILDFSELQAGDMEIVEEAYNITSTINDIINMTLARKKDKKIEFVVDCDATLPSSIVGDEQKIRRVIMNLVDNAIKYTDEGCVLLKISYRKESYGINLTVTVKDTGIGMTEANIEKLFTGFGQVDTRRNRKESGIGLGLAIASAIVEAMGGFISAKSEYARGTQMQFSIPQKVLGDSPIASVNHKDRIRTAVYIDMEQFGRMEIREAYTNNIIHMIQQLGVDCNVCRNLAELKRRVDRTDFSHIFISLLEYQEDPEYFDKLAEKTKLILVIDREDEHLVENHKLVRLYKPFFILPVIMILNDRPVVLNSARNHYHHERFIAPSAHVMIVDDNLMNIKVAEGLLKPYQVQITTAMSGREALEKIKKKCYDFIFMDHMMPEMDGVETLERIRQMPDSYCKTVPIIALTANAIGGMREMFLASGFADFVAKPIEISVLERVLKRNLPKEKLVYLSEEETAVLTESGEQAENKAAAQMEEQPGTGNGNVQGRMVIGDLDTEQGKMYCGGEENYLEVLSMQAQDFATLEKIESFYGQKDWKNYTILTHAVKSTMKSIGAQPLSDMAKGLELAGKQGDYDYIGQNHAAMVTEYKRVQKEICEHFAGEDTDVKTAVESNLPVLEEKNFEDFIIKFENAMYSLDISGMTNILEQLEGYQFCGRELKAELHPVRKKVEMSDYMSALDTLLQAKERLKRQ